MKRIEDVRVDLPRIMVEVAAESGKPGLTTALMVTNDALTQIVKRAVALEDELILEQLDRIGYTTKTEEPPA